MSEQVLGATARRGSLLMLGTTALIASIARPARFAAAKGNKKANRLKTKKCKKQVDQCIASLEELCQNDPVCESAITCCGLFSNCNAAAALPCIFIN